MPEPIEQQPTISTASIKRFWKDKDEITLLRAALKVACAEINEHRLWYRACQPSPQLGLHAEAAQRRTDAAVDLATGEPKVTT